MTRSDLKLLPEIILWSIVLCMVVSAGTWTHKRTAGAFDQPAKYDSIR